MTRALVVSVGEVAARLEWRPPTSGQRAALLAALEDAHDDVEGYLGQPITPATALERGLFPFQDRWRLEHDPITVLSVVAERDLSDQFTGLFTVTYTWGLNAAVDPELRPIRRYILAAAVEHPLVVRQWQASQGNGARRTKSLSTDGQSVSFDYLTPGGAEITRNANGTAVGKSGPRGPALGSLDRWRVAGRRVFQRAGTYLDDDMRLGGSGYRNGWWGVST